MSGGNQAPQAWNPQAQGQQDHMHQHRQGAGDGQGSEGWGDWGQGQWGFNQSDQANPWWQNYSPRQQGWGQDQGQWQGQGGSAGFDHIIASQQGGFGPPQQGSYYPSNPGYASPYSTRYGANSWPGGY